MLSFFVSPGDHTPKTNYTMITSVEKNPFLISGQMSADDRREKSMRLVGPGVQGSCMPWCCK